MRQRELGRRDGSLHHVGHRIDRLARDPHFVVKVRAGRTAGGADVADQVTLMDPLAGSDRVARGARSEFTQLVAVLDLDVVAVAAERLGLRHEAIGGGVDRGSGGAREIDTLVVAAAAQHRVSAHAVVARQRHAADRHARGNRNFRLGRHRRETGAGIERLPAREQLTEFTVALYRSGALTCSADLTELVIWVLAAVPVCGCRACGYRENAAAARPRVVAILRV